MIDFIEQAFMTSQNTSPLSEMHVTICMEEMDTTSPPPPYHQSVRNPQMSMSSSKDETETDMLEVWTKILGTFCANFAMVIVISGAMSSNLLFLLFGWGIFLTSECLSQFEKALRIRDVHPWKRMSHVARGVILLSLVIATWIQWRIVVGWH